MARRVQLRVVAPEVAAADHQAAEAAEDHDPAVADPQEAVVEAAALVVEDPVAEGVQVEVGQQAAFQAEALGINLLTAPSSLFQRHRWMTIQKISELSKTQTCQALSSEFESR